MPKGSTKTRFDNIGKEGAQVTIEELNYDDCVRLAAKEAEETEHAVIIQDTAWDGYEKNPILIMQVTAPWPTKPQSSSVNLK